MVKKKANPVVEVQEQVNAIANREEPGAIIGEHDDVGNHTGNQVAMAGRYDHLIETALTSTAPDSMEKFEKLMEMQERFEDKEARKAYRDAMVTAQASIEVVTKDLDNKQTHSTYASLGAIIESAKPYYTSAGFSVSFYEGETSKENHIRIYADVMHRSGHKESPYYDIPLDGVGIKGNANMTAIHGKASATQYAKRYLLCMIFNIATGDDDDGNAGGRGSAERVSREQIEMIRAVLRDNNFKEERLLKFKRVASIEDIVSKDFDSVIAAIEKAGNS